MLPTSHLTVLGQFFFSYFTYSHAFVRLSSESKALMSFGAHSYRIGWNFHGISVGRAMKLYAMASSFPLNKTENERIGPM